MLCVIHYLLDSIIAANCLSFAKEEYSHKTTKISCSYGFSSGGSAQLTETEIQH